VKTRICTFKRACFQRALALVLAGCLCTTPATGINPPTRAFVDSHPVYTMAGIGGAITLFGAIGAYRFLRGPIQRFNRYINTLPLPIAPIRRSLSQCVGYWLDGIIALLLTKIAPSTSIIANNTSFILGPLYAHYFENAFSAGTTIGPNDKDLTPEIKTIKDTFIAALDNPKVTRTESVFNKLFWSNSTSSLSAEQEKKLRTFLTSTDKKAIPPELIDKWKRGQPAEFAFIGPTGSGKTYSVLKIGSLLNRTVVYINAKLFKNWDISKIDIVLDLWTQLIKDRLQDGSLKTGDFIFLDATDHMTGSNPDLDKANNKLLLSFQKTLFSLGLNFVWAANILEESIPNEISRHIVLHNGHLGVARLQEDEKSRLQVCWNKVYDLMISTKTEDEDLAQKLKDKSTQEIIQKVIKKIADTTKHCPSSQIAALCERALGIVLTRTVREKLSDQDIENELDKQTLRTYQETLTTTLEKMRDTCRHNEKTTHDIHLKAKIKLQTDGIETNIEKLNKRINNIQAKLAKNKLLDNQEVLRIVGTYTHEIDLLENELGKIHKVQLAALVRISEIKCRQHSIAQELKKLPQEKEKMTDDQTLQTGLFEAQNNQFAFNLKEQESLAERCTKQAELIQKKKNCLETWKKKYPLEQKQE